jgi:hypothetical protein
MTPAPFSAKTPHNATSKGGGSGSQLASVPEDGGESKFALPATPPWSGNVSAVAIRSAFQGLEAVKVADIQFLTPPEDERGPKGSSMKSCDTSSAKLESVGPSTADGEDLVLSGVDVTTDFNVWDYDTIVSAIPKDETTLKHEFWTLPT